MEVIQGMHVEVSSWYMEDWKPKEISGLDLEIYSVSLNGSSMDDITSGENGK